MPYYRCPSCGLTSYSAATGAGGCATCAAPLPADSRVTIHPGSPTTLTRALANHPAAPAQARRAVARLPLPKNTRDELMLVVSELVTNAVCHAGRSHTNTIDLEVTNGGPDVRVSVHDGGRGFVASSHAHEDGGGRGLKIVAALSRSWGMACDGAGCTVWCLVAIA